MVGVFGDYYDLNNSVNYTKWLEYFTECILKEIIRVKDILEDSKLTPEYIILRDQAQMLKYIQNNGYINDREYKKITKRSKATRVIDYNKLINYQLIERCGRGKNTYYVLK
jgi:predicted HTH transcriptional regulator